MNSGKSNNFQKNIDISSSILYFTDLLNNNSLFSINSNVSVFSNFTYSEITFIIF